ncbi:uncharacterized protein B0I36DRAFT_312623 [Microdochium trichocladiopsis]|uniref:Uncharacterized protein n=1 Tax=Microdochium trichocladiopsis TaxID=1682393 RepID=A0A9P8YK31_9PEZI|nr:uncharacterized protein B0I36DRAFT_312623 [Microdochium trichocladiopsis]KAH7041343.1 hypothetical protein B0I36DRAFT_312623 [Microdochium trichocladiopsis]
MIATTFFREADLARSRPDPHLRWLPPVSEMTARREPDMAAAPRDWDESERQYWQSTKVARQRQDASLSQEYSARQEAIRARLIGMYDRKSQLQNELQSINASIELQENEQERLAAEHEDNCVGLASRRQQEDRAQHEWFQRARREHRVDNTGRPSIRPQSSGPRPGSGGSAASTASGPAAWTSINGARTRNSHAQGSEPPTDPGNLLSSVFHNPMDETEANARSMPFRTSKATNDLAHEPYPYVTDDYASQNKKLAERPLKPKQRHSLPGFSSISQSPGSAPPLADGSAADMKTRSPSGRKSLPGPKSSGTPSKDTFDIDDGREITKTTSTLRDDGTIITAPPMFAGCPLQKIDEKSEYWDIEWQSLESIIQPQLDRWKEKLVGLRQTPDAVRHTVFLANRQVNRGQAVMDFLADKESPFHPYQFVGKDMMAKFYKTFINYDTMFRLVNVHEELKKFDLDVSPLEWLRQRMHEIGTAQGDKFSLSKTVHDLYHDPKLKYLREKHGFGNIGRPSGYKLGEKAPDRALNKGKARRDAILGDGSMRRRGRRSIGQVDSEAPSPELASQQAHHTKLPGPDQIAAQAMAAMDPLAPRLPKRARLDGLPLPVPVLPPRDLEEDLDFSGYTSTDSFSSGRIMHLDWRIYQVRTRAMTTSTDVTQYWTWKNDANKFEHQVLRDVQPKVTWGIYQRPLNFNVTLDETIEIQYARDCPKIVVVTKSEKRGNVLAHFKRERTKKRFLSFAKKKGVKLVTTSRAIIQEMWDSMDSRTLPSDESAP